MRLICVLLLAAALPRVAQSSDWENLNQLHLSDEQVAVLTDSNHYCRFEYTTSSELFCHILLRGPLGGDHTFSFRRESVRQVRLENKKGGVLRGALIGGGALGGLAAIRNPDSRTAHALIGGVVGALIGSGLGYIFPTRGRILYQCSPCVPLRDPVRPTHRWPSNM